MATLASLSNLRGHQRGLSALGLLIQESPLIRNLEDNSGFQLAPTDDAWRPVNATTTTIQARDLGEGYTASAITPESKVNTLLRFHGGAIKIDDTHLADHERGLSDIRMYMDERVPEEFTQFAHLFEQSLIRSAGTGDPTPVKGMQYILNGTDDIPGFTGVKGVLNAATYSTGSTPKSFDMTNTANYTQFMKLHRTARQLVPGCNAMWVSPAMYASICAIADATHAGSEGRDRFGYTIKSIDGLPIIPLLDTSILNTEPDDTGTPLNVTTSIYYVRVSENWLSLLTNSGLDWKAFDLSAAQLRSGQEEWEFRCSWRLKKRNCALRVRNFKP